MLEFYEKRKLKRLLYSKPAIGVLVIIVFLLGSSVWNVYEKKRATSIKRDEAESVLQALVERERTLTAEIERLSTERGVEEEIREKFNVARVGEEVVVIVDAEEDGGTSDTEEGKGLWSRILDWF